MNKNNYCAFVRVKESGLENELVALTGGFKAAFYSIYINIPENRILAKLSSPAIAMPAKGAFYSFSIFFDFEPEKEEK